MAAGYDVNLNIALKNSRKLIDLRRQLRGATKEIADFNKKAREQNRVLPVSINSFNKQLTRARRLLDRAAVGTASFNRAAKALVNVEREHNNQLMAKEKLLNKLRLRQTLKADGAVSAADFRGARTKAIPTNPIRDTGFLDFSKAADKITNIGKDTKKIAVSTKKSSQILSQQATTAVFKDLPFGVRGGQIGPATPLTRAEKMGFGRRASLSGPFAMQGGAMGRLKGGVGSAMIGGGFPALFGAGGLSSVMGGIAGAAGGALAPGGGFAASIFATAIAAQIEKARAFRKEINNLNLDLESMGIASTFSRKQIKELAKEFKITNDEAIKLAKTFKTFGADQAGVLLSAFGSREVFDTLFGLRNTEDVLSKIQSVREKISETQRQDLLQTLATKGSLETQAKLERIIFEQRKKAFVEGEIDKIKILDIPKEFRATKTLQKEFANLKRVELGKEFEAINGSGLKILENQIKINEQMQFLAEFNAPTDELRELMNPMRQIIDLSNAIRTGFEDSFKGIIKGTMSVQDAFRNMLNRIADHFLDTAARMMASQLQKGFLGLFSNMFSFGMSSSPLSMRQQGVGKSANMLSRHSVGTSVVQPKLKFADGGRPPVGRPSIVGERGPELFMPDRAGTIIPNHAMGSTNVIVNVDASGSSVEGDEQQGEQLGALLATTIRSTIIEEQRPGGLLS